MTVHAVQACALGCGVLAASLAMPAQAQGSLNTIQDVFAAFRGCWVPPPQEQGRPGMEITARFSFRRDGSIIGEPRITFVTPDASAELRDTYRRAVADALARCTPMRFTAGLGNALAGRPFAVRFIDERGLKRAGADNGRHRQHADA